MSFSAHLSSILRDTIYQLESSESLERNALEPVLAQQKNNPYSPKPTSS